jgi:curved DNA-binding protein CbpA
MSGRVDPYKLNPLGKKINQFGPRLTAMSFNTGISLPQNKKEGKKDEGKKDGKNDDPYSYFDVPWNISLSYGFNYSKNQFVSDVTQTLTFNGNVNFTKNWTFNFSSSYDFKAKKISQAQMSVNRDLHCWQMSMSFSPFGPYKSFAFKINVKSSTLQDLKYEKKKNPGDFSRSAW